jgi:hypothetical protein
MSGKETKERRRLSWGKKKTDGKKERRSVV